jgi:hypothetical protein
VTTSGRCGLTREQLLEIGQGATLETIDEIVSRYPNTHDTREILRGFEKGNAKAYGEYCARLHHRILVWRKEREQRKRLWTIWLTSPIWLAGLGYVVYLLAEAVWHYPRQVCVVCAVTIVLKLMMEKKSSD